MSAIENTSTIDDLIVEKIYTDQGEIVILFRGGSERLIVPLDEFAGDPKALRRQAQNFFGRVVNKTEMDALIGAAQKAKPNPKVVAVTRPGFPMFDSTAPYYFAFPNGKVITSVKSEIDYIAIFQANTQAETKGSPGIFNILVGNIIRNQPIPILLLFMALSPILQPFARLIGFNVENFILELVGPTGTQKSTLTTLMAGSIWGGGSSKLGYGRSWNTTVNAVEAICSKYHNCLLILDEASAVGATPAARALMKFNFAHRLSLGIGKSRLGEADGIPFSLAAFSNSNEPLMDNLTGSRDVRAAGDVRVLTFDCADRQHGYLLPGSGRSAHIVEPGRDLRAVVQEHYGHLAPAFITLVLQRSQANFDGFKSELTRLMERFLDFANVDRANETQMRRVKPFALTYACASLAIDSGVVTIDAFGKVRTAIKKAYRLFVSQGSGRDARAEVRAFLANTDSKIRECKSGRKIEMSDQKFSTYDAFIFEVHGTRHLGIPHAKIEQNFVLPRGLIADLAHAGLLVKNDGNQFQKRIRARNGVEIKDRFYVIKVTSWPPHLKKDPTR